MKIAELWNWADRYLISSPLRDEIEPRPILKEELPSYDQDGFSEGVKFVLPVAEDVEPVVISVKRVDCTGKKDPYYEHMLVVNLTGALHPYDPDFASGCFGDGNKNPAVLPVIQLLRAKLPPVINAAFYEADLGYNGLECRFEEAKRPFGLDDHSSGFRCLLRFNPVGNFAPRERYAGYIPVDARQMRKLYQVVVDGLYRLTPEIRATLAANLHKHPNPRDHVARMEHTMNLSLTRMKAFAAAGCAVAIPAEDQEDTLGMLAQAGITDVTVVRPQDSGASRITFRRFRLKR